MTRVTMVLAMASLVLVSALPAAAADKVTVTAKNDLDLARPGETICVAAKDLGGLKPDGVVVRMGEETFVSQAVDNDADGAADCLVFQADFAANESKTFTIAAGAAPQVPSKVFGRFVPERMDDFAWENDRIAFRTYGPALRKELVSSGIDVWVKRVRTLVIDKWYRDDLSKKASYHKDSGEGCDCYTIGKARGCGGTGIWADGKLYVGENFKTWKVLANGPVRVMFELTYAPWDAAGDKVSEVKRITLDAGSNLNRVQSTFTSEKKAAELPVAIGLFTHDKAGKSAMNKKEGWMSRWGAGEKGAGNMGTGVVIDPAIVTDMVPGPDNNILAVIKAASGKPVTYYVGAGWDRSGDFADGKAWDAYLAAAAKRVASPIKVQVAK